MRRTSLVVLGFAALVTATACEGRANPVLGILGTPTGGTAAFNVTPATVTLTPGQTAQLTLNTTRAVGPYTWTTNQSGVATVSSSGLVSAIGTGSATVTVTAAGDATVSARSAITVQPSAP